MKSIDITIATCQESAIYGDIKKSLEIIKKTVIWAEKKKVDILCFPECFLQGYILNETKARKESLDFGSNKFQDILQIIDNSSTTVILGVIEKDGNHLYNTAVVIEDGKLIGKYRKQYLLNKEIFFTGGNSNPVFEKNGIKFGINICSDTRYPNSCEKLAKKGAKILFFPLNNSLPHLIANKWKDKHRQYWINRAKENLCWVVTADVVEESQTNTGYGFTMVINPDGKVLKFLGHLKAGVLKYKIT